MATQVPKSSAKRQRLAANAAARQDEELASMGKLNATVSSVLVQFQSSQDDSTLGSTLSLPASAGQTEMSKIVNELKRQLSKGKKEKDDDDDDDGEIPYTFHVLLAPSNESSSEPTRINITDSLHESVLQSATAKRLGVSLEDSLTVVFEPQAVFRVRAVSRCSSTLSGHASPILCCAFSPTGQLLATGAGDKTCRIWDMDTETPLHTLTGHTGWVLCAEWEPRERKLATGSMDGQIYIWDALDTRITGRKAWGARSGKQIDEERAERGETGRMSVAERRAARHASPPGHLLRGHTKWITSLSWEPVHRNARAPRLASSSKDGTVRIWNVERRQVDFVLGGHTASVNMVRWGGEGAIYTASSDRTVRVWNDQDGRLIRTLNDHAHWVNTLAISTDYLLRTGPFDVQGQYLVAMNQRYQKLIKEGDSASLKSLDDVEDRECQQAALSRYNEATANGGKPELVVSGSDDQTLFLWPAQIGRSTESPKKPLARLTGHQKTVNHVCFSPDSRLIASASFDNSVKLWDGRTGKFIANLRGHVASVYRLAWSSDSRMLATASKDSTIKLWNLNTFKIKQDLPGHEDEVYCVDFIADKLASGGRDRTVKIWRH
ncbi:ribosome assembly [Malassezia psittaci]|uniref:Ribosome assembly n=1 Tax=Malassezia psittaci TaxID=1821823 RepID=A0AAF0FBN5_9BASI|nr:ribosome assembly [Malassezia psittaci]